MLKKQIIRNTHPKNVYPMGKRLDALKLAGVIAILVISFVFYFIYDFLFTPLFPWIHGAPLLCLFAAADACLILLEQKVFEKMKGNHYEVRNDCLLYIRGRKETKYMWEDFSEAYYGRIQLGSICPVTFIYQGREIKLNAYTENIFDLAGEVIRHIRPYAKIEAGLEQKVSAMTGL